MSHGDDVSGRPRGRETLLRLELQEFGPEKVKRFLAQGQWIGWQVEVVEAYLELAEAVEDRAYRTAGAESDALSTGAHEDAIPIAKRANTIGWVAIGVSALAVVVAGVALLKSFEVI